MIELHSVGTPNGHKVSIMLEETGLPYEIIAYDIFAGDQLSPAFLKLNPNNKLPVIVDRAPGDGGAPLTVFETGAILVYLAEKTGQFLPTDARGRAEVLKWLFWQTSGMGPMHGQAHHFIRYAPEGADTGYARDRYMAEALRLLRVMEGRLGDVPYLAGAYSIADMAAWPWIRALGLIDVPLADYPAIEAWFRAIEARPAVETGANVILDYRKRKVTSEKVPLTPAQWAVLFGERQFDG